MKFISLSNLLYQLRNCLVIAVDTLQFLRLVSRPHHCLSAAAATLAIIYIASLNPLPAIVLWRAAWAIALCCLGASVFHYGGAHLIYARKEENRGFLQIKHPLRLVVVGFIALAAAIIIGWPLPGLSRWVLVGNALLLIGYTLQWSKHWATKNVLIALVIASPVLLGMTTAQHYPLMGRLLWLAVFLAYWGREILKDIADILANEGQRVTLPIWLGTQKAAKIAAGFLLLSAAVLLLSGPVIIGQTWWAIPPYLIAALVLILAAWRISHSSERSVTKRAELQIDLAQLHLLVAVVIAHTPPLIR